MEGQLDQELDAQIAALMSSDVAAAVARIKQLLETQSNVPLKIAITGETGSGKSTFVNSFRGMNNYEEGAAPSGFKETTREIRPYPHPNYPNVTLWDLPGIGSTRFPAEKYLENVGFRKFDFFIIISADRFRENDVKLAKEIQRLGRKFYFVRSKIDNNVQAEKQSQRDFNAEETLEQIREDCIDSLKEQGFEAPQVFLLSSFERQRYDFSILHETLERELPEHKRRALLLAMSNTNLEIITRKKEAFQTQIKYYACLSAAGAAVPLPGLSVAVDLNLIVNTVKDYVAGFGLDVPSLQRLAASTGVPFDELTFNIKSVLAKKEITKELILTLLKQLASTSGLLAAEEWSRIISVLGIPVAMGLSFSTIYRALNFFLDEIAEEAERVFKTGLNQGSNYGGARGSPAPLGDMGSPGSPQLTHQGGALTQSTSE